MVCSALSLVVGVREYQFIKCSYVANMVARLPRAKSTHSHKAQVLLGRRAIFWWTEATVQGDEADAWDLRAWTKGY